MLFKPKWIGLLAKWGMPHLVPDEKRIRDLGKLRAEFNIPHDALATGVAGSPTTTRKVQRFSLEAFRVQNQDKSEKELFRMVLQARSYTAKSTHTSGEMTEREIDQVMENINSFDDLCDYIIAKEEQERFPDPLGIGKRIDDILAQEEIDKKAPAEDLIKSSEQTYHDLRKIHPEKDVHWLLANVWIERYGSTKEAKLKGSELTRFISYKDTCLFSVLESPWSIRGLALFWVYKNFGEQCSFYYASDFSQIMEVPKRYIGSGTFLSEYKGRNPKTWEEAKIIKCQVGSESLDLYSILMSMEAGVPSNFL